MKICSRSFRNVNNPLDEVNLWIDAYFLMHTKYPKIFSITSNSEYITVYYEEYVP